MIFHLADPPEALSTIAIIIIINVIVYIDVDIIIMLL